MTGKPEVSKGKEVDLEPARAEVLDAIPERLSGDNARAVQDATASHFIKFIGGGLPTSERGMRVSISGVTGRLLASLVAAGELREDFDAEKVISNLDAIGGSD